MIRAFLWLGILLVLVGCQSPLSRFTTSNAATPRSLAIQPADLPGMHACSSSGDVASVLKKQKQDGTPGYDHNATEWEQWKQQGAVDAYFAVYGRTTADCVAASDAGTGAPQGQVMVELVVQFRDPKGAARNFQRDTMLLGLGPKDIRFIELAGGTTTFGPATGLGSTSVVGSANVAGANYFVAEWQHGRFQSESIGYDMAFADADNAVIDTNSRIPQT